MLTITEVEQAIQARLVSRIASLRKVGSLSDFLMADLDDTALLSPAAYVVFDSGSFTHGMARTQEISLTFTVVVVVENQRGNEAARHGAGSSIGVYQLLDDIRAALTNQTLGLDMEPLFPVSIQGIAGSESLAVYGITFETSCRDVIG